MYVSDWNISTELEFSVIFSIGVPGHPGMYHENEKNILRWASYVSIVLFENIVSLYVGMLVTTCYNLFIKHLIRKKLLMLIECILSTYLPSPSLISFFPPNMMYQGAGKWFFIILRPLEKYE